MKNLTTVCFPIGVKIRRLFGRLFTSAPGWLALFLFLGATAAATAPVFNGSINIPASGSATMLSPVVVATTSPLPAGPSAESPPNAQVSILGSLAVSSPNGESIISNTDQTLGKYRSNVLSLYHAASGGAAAVRFLRASDGAEVGAMGYQNGAIGGWYLNGSVYLAGTEPYINGAGTNLPPARVILGQEGAYSGNYKTQARFMADTDWNMYFYTPTGTAIEELNNSGTVQIRPNDTGSFVTGAVSLPNALHVTTGQTDLGTCDTSCGTPGGVTGSLLYVGDHGVNAMLALDGSGNLGILGNFNSPNISLTGSTLALKASLGTYATTGAITFRNGLHASTGQTDIGNCSSGCGAAGGINGTLFQICDHGVNCLFTVDGSGNAGATTFNAANGAAASCTGGYKFANGIMVITGSGAPTCTAPAASEYLRSDGASGTHIYISQGGGTWTAISGV